MCGHTRDAPINLLFNKLAPIMINYFAYPDTYAIDSFDYKFVD